MTDILIGSNFGDDAESDTPADLAETIAEVAAGPKSASNDGQSYTAQSVGDLIKADQYLAKKKASKRGTFGGIRCGVFRSPGSTGAT